MKSNRIFALKWRPKNFNDFIGQNKVVSILKNSLKIKKIYNVYLFYGIQGIGKTSLARILAKSFNCINGITSNPCCICKFCLSIDSVKCVDVIEIDAASKTKIDDIKDVFDKVNYLPINMKYKVYIIDEVHMLSRYSFNSLLKVLEEPPEYSKFILATTEFHKIPDTILSRSMVFNLIPIKKYYIINRLKFILNKEKIFFSKNVLKIISIHCNGSMRDALMLTEQLFLLNGNNKILIKDVNKLLNILSDKWIFLFLKYLFLKNKKIFFLIEKFFFKNINYNIFILNLLKILFNLFLIKIFPEYILKIIKNKNYINILYKFKNILSLNDINFYYDIFLKCRKDISNSFNERFIFEFYIMKAFSYNYK